MEGGNSCRGSSKSMWQTRKTIIAIERRRMMTGVLTARSNRRRYIVTVQRRG